MNVSLSFKAKTAQDLLELRCYPVPNHCCQTYCHAPEMGVNEALRRRKSG